MKKKNSLTPKKCVKVEKVSDLRGITVCLNVFIMCKPANFGIVVPFFGTKASTHLIEGVTDTLLEGYLHHGHLL